MHRSLAGDDVGDVLGEGLVRVPGGGLEVGPFVVVDGDAEEPWRRCIAVVDLTANALRPVVPAVQCDDRSEVFAEADSRRFSLAAMPLPCVVVDREAGRPLGATAGFAVGPPCPGSTLHDCFLAAMKRSASPFHRGGAGGVMQRWGWNRSQRKV